MKFLWYFAENLKHPWDTFENHWPKNNENNEIYMQYTWNAPFKHPETLIRHPWDTLETPLRHPWDHLNSSLLDCFNPLILYYTSNALGTLFKHPETPLRHLWDTLETPLKLPWNHLESWLLDCFDHWHFQFWFGKIFQLRNFLSMNEWIN